MADKPSLEELTGGPVEILDALLADQSIAKARNVSIPAAMAVARKIAMARAEAALVAIIHPVILDTYETYEIINGEFTDCATRFAADEWEAGLDDAMEKALTPYEKWVTASWFGIVVTDVNIHKPKSANEPADPTVAMQELAHGFAKDAWKVYTHYYDKEEDAVKEKTTAQILSAIGLVGPDIEAALAARPQPTAEETAQTEEHEAMTLNSVMNKLHAALTHGGAVDLPTEKQLLPLFENATDDDDGIAASGIKGLGGDMADVEVLRLYAMGSAEPADELTAMLLEAPYDSETGAPQQIEAVATSSEADELAALMGGAVGFTASGVPVIETDFLPPPPPDMSPGAVNRITIGAPPSGSKPPVTGKAPVDGEVDPRVFQLMKAHIKEKDEDVGKMLGVSRQTYINYGKTSAKAKYVPTEDQRAVLRELLVRHRDGIENALELLG